MSDGILELIAAGRLSATSALVTLDNWVVKAPALRAQREKAAVGLHLNLTLGAPLTKMPRLAPEGRFPSIAALIRLTLTGRLDAEEIAGEISAQFDAFESQFGRRPDFLDGHEHCHVLPTVRTCLLRILRNREPSANFVIRDPTDSLILTARRPALLKGLIVRGLATGLRSSVLRGGFASNCSFAGFSSFDEGQPYASEFETFLTAASSRHLIMCHPGLDDSAPVLNTKQAARRVEEFKVLLNRPGLPELIWHPLPAERGGRGS